MLSNGDLIQEQLAQKNPIYYEKLETNTSNAFFMHLLMNCKMKDGLNYCLASINNEMSQSCVEGRIISW